MKARAVFLDRDGVLNRAVVRNGRPYPPASAKHVEVFPGLADRLQLLKDRGFRLIVATNQPDVARGKTTKESVEAINDRIARVLPAIDRFMVCFHDNADNCECRKPKCGMLRAAAADYAVDLASSYMVGDRWSDIAAGRAAGARTIFIDYGYAEPAPTGYDHKVSSTIEALDIIESEAS